ncbi:hypothetical protein YC2023_042742 [Brassica napus]
MDCIAYERKIKKETGHVTPYVFTYVRPDDAASVRWHVPNAKEVPVATELGITVVPTFKILKDGKVIKEVVGAKFDELLAAIDAARSG